MFYFVQQYCKEVIEKKRRGFFPFLLRLLLHPFSWLFHLGITARNWAFDHGWLRRYYPPIPAVISVGNIVAGGTGKTPTVEMIAREFVPEYSLAILSRGYRSPAEKQDESTILSKGMGPKGMRQDSGADLCGDEPYLLSVRLPEALVIVGKNRRESSKLAARNGAQIIILDDGMQHRSLARDFEVVVMHGEDLFGGGYFLPRGFLREGKNSLERSDLIIINHIHDRDHFCSLKKEIIPYTAAPVIGTQMIVKQMKSLTGALFNCSAMQGKRAGVFCGIANPDSFKNSLKNLGLTVVAEEITPDHIAIKPSDLIHFSSKCEALGADYLICTEKDKVKLSSKSVSSLPILYTEAELKVVEGLTEWESFISQVKSKILCS